MQHSGTGLGICMGAEPGRGSAQVQEASHRRGCQCRKSRCRKKYCECFHAGVHCSDACRCNGCQNAAPEGASPGGGLPEALRGAALQPYRSAGSSCAAREAGRWDLRNPSLNPNTDPTAQRTEPEGASAAADAPSLVPPRRRVVPPARYSSPGERSSSSSGTPSEGDPALAGAQPGRIAPTSACCQQAHAGALNACVSLCKQ